MWQHEQKCNLVLSGWPGAVLGHWPQRMDFSCFSTGTIWGAAAWPPAPTPGLPKSCILVIFKYIDSPLRQGSSTKGLRITAFSIKVPGGTLTAAFDSGADEHFGCEPSYSPCLFHFHWHHGIGTKHWKGIPSQLKGPGRCSLGAHLVKSYH